MRQSTTILVTGFFMLCACIETTSRRENQEAPATQTPISTDGEEVISLLGKVFRELPLSDSERSKRERELMEARTAYETDPDKLENIIWFGRRLAYLGHFKEAIRIYSVGLDKYPDSYKLLRHRGHRYITLRKFDQAIEDLQKAAFYARPHQNEIEPDGIPNRINRPLSNTKFNIWYHLGVGFYLKGNYDKAISSFKKCMEFADNDDLKVAVTDWFYMTYKKIGNNAAAEQLLTPINQRMRIIENSAYLDRLLMYKGTLSAEKLLNRAQSGDESIEPTLGYGIGNWYAYNGRLDDAREVLFRITVGPRWDSFGFIAAEVDLLSLKDL